MKIQNKKSAHLRAQIKKYEEDEKGDIYIKGYASTDGVDRMDDIILKDAWDLRNYEKNPILLFNHNYNEPIGVAELVEVRSGGLYLEGKISGSCSKICELIKAGVLRTFSVGFWPKDVKYVPENDGFIIKEAELLEVSVVSVPANADATFSVAKQLDQSLINKIKGEELDTPEQDAAAKEYEMTHEEIQKAIEAAAAKASQSGYEAAQKAMAEKEELERKQAEALAAEKAQAERVAEQVRVEVGSNMERLEKDLESKLADYASKNQDFDVDKIFKEMQPHLKEYGAQLVAHRDRKGVFDAGAGRGDWKKEFAKDLEDAWVLGVATRKGYNTDFAKEVFEKVNTHSGIEVSSEDFEQVVSTRVEREIQNRLVLAPLFQEVSMTSASQILPILPDSGYAEFTANTTASGTAPKGNLDRRSAAYGDHDGIDLDERTLTTKKLISRTYLGNETEEDAILPILPLIREAMVRSHARSVEAAMLVGNHADGPFGTAGASFNGLIKIADDNSLVTQQSTGTFADYPLTSDMLLGARKNMGKYGVMQRDMVYLVSQRAWFELLEDPEFQDVNLVADQASKLTGEVGRIYGTPVLLCDEFATPANDVFFAASVYTGNYVVPRLRGVRLESDYETGEQRTVLVASQRLGFQDIFQGASSVWALQYNSGS